MSSLSAQPFAGLFRASPEVSTIAFAVRHSGVFRFRGTLSDVTATLRGDGGDAPALEGSARVASISIAEPAALRASVLGPEFFDVEHHPELSFRSTAIRLGDDGQAAVDGELTMRGVTRTVTAAGQFDSPRQVGFGEAAGMRLQTTVDRRDWGFDWQVQLPGGGNAVAWDVEFDVDLLFMRAEADADG
ncbi:YceI family protein [Conexibacter sp. CPCC 206217]|uniref:YceI family protein n=1 Tax=Conexibacter sp. CPCC 206217 TaxID=3064574 RepID=UPI002723E683|nr:YceI family protein [Conexibacter sp. CPCC 206217]MDO8212615.1 YceI family protein [Conexibacter sp. CPCC 206217]